MDDWVHRSLGTSEAHTTTSNIKQAYPYKKDEKPLVNRTSQEKSTGLPSQKKSGNSFPGRILGLY